MNGSEGVHQPDVITAAAEQTTGVGLFPDSEFNQSGSVCGGGGAGQAEAQCDSGDDRQCFESVSAGWQRSHAD